MAVAASENAFHQVLAALERRIGPRIGGKNERYEQQLCVRHQSSRCYVSIM
jgi:hypothetical protein